MNPIGLYLHIPFCDGKCAYCNFFSSRANEAQLSEYTTRLMAYIHGWGERSDRVIDTVYFGGGTPSLLGHDRLISILDSIKHSFILSDDPEITAEVNPSSTNELDFTLLRQAGFNRLSIGLQSANNEELRTLGRRHSLADARRTVQKAQAGGFDNISLDVMLAIPHQTIDSLNETLDFCASCNVQNISAYILKVEEGTRFYQMKDDLPLFSDDEQASFYEHTVNRLAEYGYKQYEISNFARIGYESRHNLHYWHDDEYLGIGPSAHSFLNGKRFYYNADMTEFAENRIVFESEGGDSDEYIMLALRLNEGLIFNRYQQRFGHSVSEGFLQAALRLQSYGLCRVNEKSLYLTTEGFLVSNSVIGYLLENT